jgi:hypothetical protein
MGMKVVTVATIVIQHTSVLLKPCAFMNCIVTKSKSTTIVTSMHHVRLRHAAAYCRLQDDYKADYCCHTAFHFLLWPLQLFTSIIACKIAAAVTAVEQTTVFELKGFIICKISRG